MTDNELDTAIFEKLGWTRWEHGWAHPTDPTDLMSEPYAYSSDCYQADSLIDDVMDTYDYDVFRLYSSGPTWIAEFVTTTESPELTVSRMGRNRQRAIAEAALAAMDEG